MKMPQKRQCVRCSSNFWEDGNSFCPSCDVESQSKNMFRGTHPDAPNRVRLLRNQYQTKLAFQAAVALAEAADGLSDEARQAVEILKSKAEAADAAWNAVVDL